MSQMVSAKWVGGRDEYRVAAREKMLGELRKEARTFLEKILDLGTEGRVLVLEQLHLLKDTKDNLDYRRLRLDKIYAFVNMFSNIHGRMMYF